MRIIGEYIKPFADPCPYFSADGSRMSSDMKMVGLYTPLNLDARIPRQPNFREFSLKKRLETMGVAAANLQCYFEL